MTSLSSLPFTQSPLYIFAHQFFYILTGLFQTLGAQWLYYQGAASGKAFTTSTAQYFGMACIGLFLPCMGRSTFGKNFEYVNLPTINDTKAEPPVFVPDQKSARSKHTPAPMNHRALIRLASLDVVANFLVTVGFFYVGSGMYQVIYSSVVIWCAILSYFFMGRKLAPTQWFAIFGTSAGLALSTLGNVGAGGDATSNATLMFGMFVTLFATFLYAGVYVLADYIMTPNAVYSAPSPFRMCFWIGFYCLCYALLWVTTYTIPRLDELFHLTPGTTSTEVAWCYAILVVASLVHAVNYYELIEKTGPVAVGVLNGLRAILVFGLSHQWYCETDLTQCFTVYKGWGSITVVGCVLLFTLGGRKGAEKDGRH